MRLRTTIACILLLLSSFAMGQTDTTLNVTISSKRPLPQIGLDLKGRKYFVMSTRQDKAVLMELQSGLYRDSLLSRYETLQKDNERDIRLLKGRIQDQGRTIDKNVKTIAEWEQAYRLEVKKNENLQKNVDDQGAYIRRKKLSWWVGIGVGVVGGLIIVDRYVDFD